MPNIQFIRGYLLIDTIMGWVLSRRLELMRRMQAHRFDEEIAVTVKQTPEQKVQIHRVANEETREVTSTLNSTQPGV